MLNPRFKENGRLAARRQAGRRVTRISGLAMAAGLVAGGLSAAVSAPAALGATAPVNYHNVNVRTAPVSTLRKLAWNDWMGHTLPRHRGTSVKASAVPLLSQSAGKSSPAITYTVYGIDVSAYQGNVNWAAVKNVGKSFAYIKATEGNYYFNPYFTEQYNGSYSAGLIRGVYAFAIPNRSSGANQADYLVSGHGGGWSADGHTLPAALDIEYNPYAGGECYGQSQAGMRSWISSFVNEYHKRTTRWPVIYSTFDWWNTCTGNWSGTHTIDPFWIARYSTSAGTLPSGYGFWTFWQNADVGNTPGDMDVFDGSLARLVALAKNT